MKYESDYHNDFEPALYAVNVERLFNCFDAWVATGVTLFKRIDGEWVPINGWRYDSSWSYDAISNYRVSMWRANRKAKKLMSEYNAIRI